MDQELHLRVRLSRAISMRCRPRAIARAWSACGSPRDISRRPNSTAWFSPKTVDFPGALHEGNGQSQPIIDERATAEQREALFNIMSGKFSA
jgi:hypothetical protein